jgi:hypothetical protein
MRRKVYRFSQEERERLIGHLLGILENHGEVVFSYVFGSFAEGEPFHDIDIGIYLSDITNEQSTPYSLALSQDLSTRLQVPADVRILNFAPVSFLYHVIRGRLVSERNKEIRLRIVERTIQRYLDLKPIIRRGVKEAFGG